MTSKSEANDTFGREEAPEGMMDSERKAATAQKMRDSMGTRRRKQSVEDFEAEEEKRERARQRISGQYQATRNISPKRIEIIKTSQKRSREFPGVI